MSSSPAYFGSPAIATNLPRISPLARVAMAALGVMALAYVYIIFTFDVPKPLLILPGLLLASAALIATGRRWAAIPAMLLVVANIVIEGPMVFKWHLHDVETANAMIANVVILPAAIVVAGAAATGYTLQSFRGRCLELGNGWKVALPVVAGAVIGGSLIALAPHYGATSRVSTAAVESLEPSIVMGDSLFRETEMRVDLGETVGWRVMNADSIGHTFDIDGLGIHMTLEGGSSGFVMFVADKAGTFEYNCVVPGHEDMKGTLVVQ